MLKSSQQYNLAKVCKIDILDRERLILDIFELRASTAESRIQIKLAQLRYDMVRAREKVRLARAGEQPGFFGMGKYDADVYFLDIKKRSAILKKKLEREEKRTFSDSTIKSRFAYNFYCWLYFCRKDDSIQYFNRRIENGRKGGVYYSIYLYSSN